MDYSIFLLLMTALVTVSKATSRPNIILIVADDLGYNDVSFHGSNQIPTPNIDYLAYSGIILNNYYVSPICTPTRSALMTGRHPIHTGMQTGVIVGTEDYGLPLNETIMPQHFKPLGYRSHIVGKWHLGMLSWDYTPLYRGFESHIGYYQGCEDYYDHTYEANKAQWGLDFRRDKDLLWNYTGKYSTEVYKEEAVNIINTHNQSEPLFLYLPFQAVHSGNGDGPHLQAPVEYIKKFGYIKNHDRRIYAAMVSAMDDAVGAVHDALKNTGMLNNSIIVFTTDNGGPANGFDFNAANNFPLRGVKATLWEGGVRGVGFIHSPLLQNSSYVSGQMLHVCDWLPTLYEAAGGDPANLKNLDGTSAWKMLSTNGSAIRSEMLHNIDPIYDFAGIRVGDYKLLIGDVGMSWDGWYPPYQLVGDEVKLHYSIYKDTESPEALKAREEMLKEFYKYWGPDVVARMRELYSHDEDGLHRVQKGYTSSSSSLTPGADSRSDVGVEGGGLKFQSESDLTDANSADSLKSFDHNGEPVTVKCGPKPANASTNCRPKSYPCLFHIPSDPCEFSNIASSHPDIVVQLYDRLKYYISTMVTPGNKPFDNRGNPKHHGGAWVPWR